MKPKATSLAAPCSICGRIIYIHSKGGYRRVQCCGKWRRVKGKASRAQIFLKPINSNWVKAPLIEWTCTLAPRKKKRARRRNNPPQTS